MLSKYVAQYAAHLIKENNTMKALELFVKHGAPPISQVTLIPTRTKSILYIIVVFFLKESGHAVN